MAQIPKKIQERLFREVPKLQRVLQAGKHRDINESDTGLIVADILSTVFGFDRYSEVTSEMAIRGTYCDLAVKVDGKVQYLVEVKAIGLDLKDTHLKQAVDYGANQGIPYVVLTNGILWKIHRIRFEKPIQNDEICAFNFLELSPRRDADQEQLYLLCKEGLSKAAIEEFSEHVQTVNRFVISAVLLTDPVVDLIRREMRRLAPGLRVDEEEVLSILQNEVLKREVIEGAKAHEAMSRVKRAAGRSLRKEREDEARQPSASAGTPPMLPVAAKPGSEPQPSQ
ncbi:MAG TPA: type I restriction enzyme HsdR N-terminal domain-containing protein [Candidatus Polarisedimenticolia bacterium]|jgi:predicted type IV restriction endonuclease|nr:type I restriction enzyme HsdR N-terminal domain-containing protein [Candidatus Polarisedimenticolia bacterium]